MASGTFPRWSPDGRWIAFVAASAAGSEIDLTRPDGTGHHTFAR